MVQNVTHSTFLSRLWHHPTRRCLTWKELADHVKGKPQLEEHTIESDRKKYDIDLQSQVVN